MITCSVARQRLGKHVSTTTDKHATIKDIVENGVYYAIHADTVTHVACEHMQYSRVEAG
jgi:hypothetical protein